MASVGARGVRGAPASRGWGWERWFPLAAVVGTGLVLAAVTVRVGEGHARAGGFVVLALAALVAALVLADLRRLLLVAIIFDLALQWDVNFYYRTAAADLGAFGGLSLSVTTFALVGLYALWLVDRGAMRGQALRLRFRPARPLIAYVAATALSILVARDKGLSLFEIVLLVQMLLLFVYIASAARTREDISFILGALLVSLAFESLVVIGLYFGGDRFAIAGISARVDQPLSIAPAQEQLRTGGTLGAPNTAGAYFSLLLALAAAVLATSAGRGLKRLAAVAFALGVVALILTFSRGGWAAFVISMAVLSYAGWRRGWFRGRVPVTIALAALVLALPFASEIGSRLDRNDAGAAHTRVPLMRLAFRIIEDHPLLGVGANNFALVIPDYATPDLSREFLYTVHNKFLAIWSQAGLAALAAFLWFLGSTLRRARRIAGAGHDFASPLAIGIGAAVLGHMAHMTVEIFQGRPATQLLWVLAGLLAAMGLLTTEQRARSLPG